ncbi:hypothetical protein [Novosphingobium sp. ZW T3_23]|uniref:hypothetical protein n=1 Tax=Novosphingobium sp. ZW T3_23 TaxID=3378084 RepID=UPI003851B66F
MSASNAAGRYFLIPIPILGLALAGCSAEKKPQEGTTDPALTEALGDRIVVDPEKVAGQAEAGATTEAPITLPAAARTPQALAAARKSAADAVGGELLPLPTARKGGASALAEAVALAARTSEQSRVAKTDCAAKAAFSEGWAAKLPAAVPVYPRAAVHEAAGTDAGGCSLRVVNFGTAVSPEDVAGFYYSAAQRGGYGAEYRIDGGEYVVGGSKAGRAYVVYARKLASGVTEVDLVTSGG